MKEMCKLKNYCFAITCLIATALLVGCGHQRIRFVKTGSSGIEKRITKDARVAEESANQQSIRMAEIDEVDETEIETELQAEAEIFASVDEAPMEFSDLQSDKVEQFSSPESPEDPATPEEIVTPEMKFRAKKAENMARAAKVIYIIGALFFWTVLIDLALVLIGSIFLIISSKAHYITVDGVRQIRLAKIALTVALSLVIALVLVVLIMLLLIF